MFILKIETANDAFQDGNCDWEIARILRRVADLVSAHGAYSVESVNDINGNKVARCSFDDD